MWPLDRKTKKGGKSRKRLKEKMKKVESVCRQFLEEIKYFRFAFLEVSKTVFNIWILILDIEELKLRRTRSKFIFLKKKPFEEN